MAGIKALKKLNSNNTELARFENLVREALGPIIRSNVIDGVLLSGVALKSGQANPVNHGLGRVLQGWIIVGKSSSADIWDSQASNDLPSRTVLLNCSADVTVNLWCF